MILFSQVRVDYDALSPFQCCDPFSSLPLLFLTRLRLSHSAEQFQKKAQEGVETFVEGAKEAGERLGEMLPGGEEKNESA